MRYLVFYSAARLGDVAGSDAVEMAMADFLRDVFPAIKENEEFFGLVDSAGTTLQAMYRSEDDTYWFEVPRPDVGGSYGTHLSFEAARDLLASLSGPVPLEGYDGFEFKSWS